MINTLDLFKHLIQILTIFTLKAWLIELQLNKANASATEPLFSVYIYLFQTDLFHPIYDKCDDFEFDKVFCFLFGW